MSESKKSLEQVEKEQMTRRQALRKFGFGAGLSAFMLLGVDDLARMVGQKMQQMDGDNKVADKVAREFQSAGVAFASSPDVSPSCQHCCNQDFDDHCYCVETYAIGSPTYQACNTQATNNFTACANANCGAGGCNPPSGPCPPNPSPPFGWFY